MVYGLVCRVLYCDALMMLLCYLMHLEAQTEKRM
jgi:hypothetical protein